MVEKKKKNRMGYFALAKVYSWKDRGSFSLSPRSGVVLHSQMPSLEEKVGKRERERWMKCTKKTVTIFVEMQNCTLDVSLMFCLAFDRHTNTLKGIAHRFFFFHSFAFRLSCAEFCKSQGLEW